MHEFINSEDGSHTLRSSQFGVTYHSKHGAIQETQTVFIDSGLKYQIEKGLKNINILEMGFGTGLNAIMTSQYISDKETNINYHTVEAYPLSMETAGKLNYPSVLSLNEIYASAFIDFHRCENDQIVQVNNFSFKKSLDEIQNLALESSKYDIIYYDAFSPTEQEELWTEEMMGKLFECTAKGGVLVTYCAKGAFKRSLKSVGYRIEALPGPKGKREMTRAVKD